MRTDVSIVAVGPERIDELLELWLELHHYQGALSEPVADVPLLADEETAERSRELYLDALSKPGSFAFVAEAGGRTLGFVLGYAHEVSEIWDTGPIGYVDSFLVREGERGRGVGRLLLDAAYEHMRKAGVQTVALDVVPGNEAARRFYEREGFVPVLLHMYRALPPAGLPLRS